MVRDGDDEEGDNRILYPFPPSAPTPAQHETLISGGVWNA